MECEASVASHACNDWGQFVAIELTPHQPIVSNTLDQVRTQFKFSPTLPPIMEISRTQVCTVYADPKWTLCVQSVQWIIKKKHSDIQVSSCQD